MALRDILLHIDTYPDPVTPDVVSQAVGFAAMTGARLTGYANEIDFRAPANRMADYLIGLSKIAQEEEERCRRACRKGLEALLDHARDAGVEVEAVTEKAEMYAVGEKVARRARTRDLCLVPLGAAFSGQGEVVHAVVFDSGRPALIFQPGAADLPSGKLGLVVVAWDGGRAAARALADSLPLLAMAAEVRVLTVVGEKPSATQGLAQEAARHLKLHGIDAVADDVESGGQRIGYVLDTYLQTHQADLLVMGAYGRSRLREFILGGATNHVLAGPVTPVLFSH